MSLTVHVIADNFTLQSRCLQTLEVPQDHDAASLKDVLSSMFSDWKITDKVCGGITDNGSNIVNAFTLLNIDHFPCIAHTLQLAVNKGLKVRSKSAENYCTLQGNCQQFQEINRGDLQVTRKARIVKVATTHAPSRLCNMLG